MANTTTKTLDINELKRILSGYMAEITGEVGYVTRIAVDGADFTTSFESMVVEFRSGEPLSAVVERAMSRPKMKVVKQSLSRPLCVEVANRLAKEELHPQVRCQPSLSGHTMDVFRVLVPEAEFVVAKQLL